MLLAVSVFTVLGPLEVFALVVDEGNDAPPAAEESFDNDETYTDSEESTIVIDEAEEAVEEMDGGTYIEEEQIADQEVVAKQALGAAAPTLTVSTSPAATSATIHWTFAGEGVSVEKYSVTVNGTTYDVGSSTSKTVSGLKEGTKYNGSVAVTYIYDNDTEQVITDTSSFSFTTKVKAPSKVTGVKALSNYESVVLKWKKVSNAHGYILHWSGNGKSGDITIDKSKTSYKQKVAADKTYTYTIKAYRKVNGIKSYSDPVKKKGAAIRLMHLIITFRTNRTLVSHSGGKKYVKFKAGKSIKTIGYNNGRYIFKWKCSDGKTRIFYVTRLSISKASVVKISKKILYDKEEAENFVNDRKLASNSAYLIWVNQYTQREYIFKGKKGKWKLVKGPWRVSTGKPSEATNTGMSRIRLKDGTNHGIPYWNVCGAFSVHGQKPGQSLGFPKSGACVRNADNNAKWIYNTCPVGTAVYIY